MKIVLILLCVCGIAFFAACNKTEDNNFMRNKDMARKINDTPIEALSRAAINGDIEKVKKLIATGNITDDSYNEALDFAAEQGYPEIVKLLIESGADVNLKIISKENNNYEHGDGTGEPYFIYQIYERSILNKLLKEQAELKKTIKFYDTLYSYDTKEELQQREKNIAEIIKILKKAGAKDTEKFIGIE